MKSNNKERLLVAAIELFAEDGYDKVSISKIAAKAEVNSALIAYYFGGKEKLYNAALEKQVELLSEFLNIETETKDPQEILWLYAVTLQKIHAQNPKLMKFINREIIKPSEYLNIFVKTRLQRVYGILLGAITSGIEKKIFRADLDKAMTVLLWVSIVNFYYFGYNIHTRVRENEIIDEQAYMRHSFSVFLKGIERG